MPIRYPRQWAAFEGFTATRLSLHDAIQFVTSVQSLEFGQLLELQDNYEEYPRGAERDMEIEQELQANLDSVVEWLEALQADGQQTISRQKVIDQMEVETGYEFEFTE